MLLLFMPYCWILSDFVGYDRILSDCHHHQVLVQVSSYLTLFLVSPQGREKSDAGDGDAGMFNIFVNIVLNSFLEIFF